MRTTTPTRFSCRFLKAFPHVAPVTAGLLAVAAIGTVQAAEKPAAGTAAVKVVQKGDDVEITIGDALFTRYTTKSGPNKPFFYPILTPDGANLTRRWPIEENTEESHDHPHHRGLWFTHGSVNGVDFWSERGDKVGKTVNTKFENLKSGNGHGSFRAHTDWLLPDGKLIANDVRDVRVAVQPNGDRLLDFQVTITPVGGPLVFGDTKEGSFGVRVTDSLSVSPDKSSKIKGEGHIETSAGDHDKMAWGKRADWVDYWGPVNGQTYGIAIFDSPSNLRHPTTWHDRDYGLFAVNPFGLHDFGQGDKGAGDYTVPLGKSQTFRYRVLFHKGDTTTAAIADQYKAYTAGDRAAKASADAR